jgi:hypothetical protein
LEDTHHKNVPQFIFRGFFLSFVEIDGVAAGLQVLDNIEVAGGKAERFENHVAQLHQIF